jgi:hypothetical protein
MGLQEGKAGQQGKTRIARPARAAAPSTGGGVNLQPAAQRQAGAQGWVERHPIRSGPMASSCDRAVGMLCDRRHVSGHRPAIDHDEVPLNHRRVEDQGMLARMRSVVAGRWSCDPPPPRLGLIRPRCSAPPGLYLTVAGRRLAGGQTRRRARIRERWSGRRPRSCRGCSLVVPGPQGG